MKFFKVEENKWGVENDELLKNLTHLKTDNEKIKTNNDDLKCEIKKLEKQLKNDNLELPPIFSDLKSQVENFRNKLETTERYKKIELQKEPFCQRYQYRRTSSERGRKIREKFLNVW